MSNYNGSDSESSEKTSCESECEDILDTAKQESILSPEASKEDSFILKKIDIEFII